MRKYYSDKSCENLLRVLLFIVTMGLIYLIKYYLYRFGTLMWILIGILSVAFIFISIVWMPLYFKQLCYVVSSEEIIRNSGFFIHVRQVMKVSSIQYITEIHTPFSKFTAFNFVAANALGGNLLFLFLSRKDCDEIVQVLTKEIFSRE